MDNGASSYRRYLEGDESAFDEIMKELFYPLVYFVSRYVHDTHTAEDIAIDSFSELVVHKHRYNFKVTLKTYLFMIGRSRAIDYLRRCKKITALDDAVNLSDDAKELEETVITNERQRVVNAAVARLPQEMSMAVHLVYFEEMTYEQAARVMKKNRKQVDNLLYRAKKELRDILGEEGELLL